MSDAAWAGCLSAGGEPPAAALAVVAELRRGWTEGRARILLLTRGDSVHGMVAARRVPLRIRGQPVEGWQIGRLLVDDAGRGRAPILMRRILAEGRLFFGMANERALRLWDRVAGRRFRVVAPLRILALSPRRRWSGAGGWSRRSPADAAALGADLPIVVDRAGAESPWTRRTAGKGGGVRLLAGAAGRGLALECNEIEGRRVVTLRDLVADLDALPDAHAQIRHETRRLGATLALVPALEGPWAAAWLELGARPAAGWDPGPALVLHEGTGHLDLDLLRHPGNWDLPGWVSL